jgi:CheY-like chemotaxis protein
MSRILIIENDALTLRLYQIAFKNEGYEVDIAADGEQGLERTRKTKPTLILLDIMMPKMDGIEMLKVLKSDSEFKNIPVVTLTNLSGEEDVKVAISHGVIKHLTKTKYTPKEVVRIVKSILTSHT